MQKRFGIGWAVVHIQGKEGFQEEVLPKLRNKYLSGNSKTHNQMMICVPVLENLRSLRLAIGSQVILKYRLHFFTLDRHRKMSGKFLSEISTSERGIESQMTVWQNNRIAQPEVVTE